MVYSYDQGVPDAMGHLKWIGRSVVVGQGATWRDPRCPLGFDRLLPGPTSFKEFPQPPEVLRLLLRIRSRAGCLLVQVHNCETVHGTGLRLLDSASLPRPVPASEAPRSP